MSHFYFPRNSRLNIVSGGYDVSDPRGCGSATQWKKCRGTIDYNQAPMRRETRANLIFLTLFLGVTIPGAVVLFKKKLDPAAPPMFMPDFVRRRLPYMASQQSPAQVVRYVPELTGAWVSEMTRERAGGSRVLMVGRHEQPLVSDDHVIQGTAMQQQQDAASTMLYLIVWD